MEQAINLFTKGLQMDTYPMVLSSEALTDCLNGTLVTMNGNEVILLNDMGNRRVDNAFLPSGYLPVGIKEYGGIIYVAAYNPITNKSLIGSFPSPLKKIDLSENSGEFLFSWFINKENLLQENNIKYLKSSSFIIPLTGETSLRAGDKFIVYSDSLYSNLDDVTNYNNIEGNKAKSPKNKKYTLALGILNSLSEFVDITKTLCRWEEKNGKWAPKVYDKDKSDVYKFNDCYFIAGGFDPEARLSTTIDDAELIKLRLKVPANTYSYKLAGPLYLKVLLNHIENFNYNIYGTYNNNIATLWIEGYITYNCPDGVINELEIEDGNENYYTFDEGIPDFDAFNLIKDTGLKESSSDPIRNKSVYNPNTNTYSTKIVKKYSNISATDGIYKYTLGVLSGLQIQEDNELLKDIYLKELSVSGQLNLNLLGSGEVKLTGWKFYNDLTLKSTLLLVYFEAYPEYGKKFSNLTFTFTDVEDRTNVIKYGEFPLYNGRYTYNINWGASVNFEPNKLYEVTYSYDIIGNNESGHREVNEGTRWFLTTELFNDFYPNNSKISDFCNTEDLEFKDKMKIKLKINGEVSGEILKEGNIEGSLVSRSPSIKYIYNHTYKVVANTNSSLYIVDKELYPKNININSEIENPVEIDRVTKDSLGGNPTTDLNINFKNLLEEQDSTGEETQLKNNFEEEEVLTFNNFSTNEKTFEETLTFKDIYMSNGEQVENISNGFSDLSDIIEDALPVNKYCGLTVRGKHETGSDHHYLEVAVSDYPYTVTHEGDNLGIGYTRLALSKGNWALWSFGNYANRIYPAFNNALDSPGQMFTFLFIIGSLEGFTNLNPNINAPANPIYTRLWWRTSNGDWATFNDLLVCSGNNINETERIRESVKSFIERNINTQYVYCMYENYSFGPSESKVYAPKNSYIYYKEYSIPLTYKITYKVEVENDLILNIPYLKLGNLEFSCEVDTSYFNTFTVNLNSSESFHNSILTFNIDSISNIDLSTGLTTDSLGRALNKNYIYIRNKKGETSELVRLDENYLKVDFDNTINGKYPLLYNRKTKKSPTYGDKQFTHPNNEGRTYLVYDLTVNTVQLPLNYGI